MLLIRFQPRRVVNVVAGLTIFWCVIISAFFWVKGGFNFGFLVMLAATVVGGFFLACMQADWQALAGRLEAAKTAFVLAPQVRFEGQPGEQWTMFFCDPCGNPVEVKGFRSLGTLYAA